MEQEIIKPCTCKICVNACERYPGWMTPEEAEQAIDSGYALKLMVDWFEDYNGEGNVEVLAPASKGFEGSRAPEISYEGSMFASLLAHYWSPGPCVFLKNRRCSIHYSGFKPIHCRTFSCIESESYVSKHEVAGLWQSKKGAEVMRKWEKALEARKQ